MPKFAANLTLQFNEVPFLERFEAAAKAGFRAVEFLFPYDHDPQDIAARLETHGLRNVLFNLPPGDWAGGERGLASLPGREPEFRAGLATAIDYARVLKTPCLHVMAGLLPEGADPVRHRATYVDNLRSATAEAARHGITLLIEPINPFDMPRYFLNRQADAHMIRNEVGAPNLKVQMDFYHAQIVEGDVSALLPHYLPQVGHIQIAGVPGRHEPDRGEIDYRRLFELLDHLGYEGWIGCEYRPAGVTELGLGWLTWPGCRFE